MCCDTLKVKAGKVRAQAVFRLAGERREELASPCSALYKSVSQPTRAHCEDQTHIVMVFRYIFIHYLTYTIFPREELDW